MSNDAYNRRNERARAEGWSSYGQKRHAAAQGFTTHGAWASQQQAKATGQLAGASATGHLLGAATVGTGPAYTAVWDTPGSMRAQWNKIRNRTQGTTVRRWNSAKQRVTSVSVGGTHVGINVRLKDGQSYALGATRGGYSIGYLQGLVATHGSWKGAVLALLALVYGLDDDEPDIDTVTVTITRAS